MAFFIIGIFKVAYFMIGMFNATFTYIFFYSFLFFFFFFRLLLFSVVTVMLLLLSPVENETGELARFLLLFVFSFFKNKQNEKRNKKQNKKTEKITWSCCLYRRRNIGDKKRKEKKVKTWMPTAPGVPSRSPIQVLTGPDVA